MNHQWKMVPVEPTDEMETAAEDDYEQTGATFPRWKSAYAAMLAAAPTAPAANGWLDIASAPKTGRTLLLGYWNSHGKWRTLRGQWMSAAHIAESFEEPDDAKEGWFETSTEADDVPNCWPVTPSHWQPMPAAPGTPPASAQDDAKEWGAAFDAWFSQHGARAGLTYEQIFSAGWSARPAPAAGDALDAQRWRTAKAMAANGRPFPFALLPTREWDVSIDAAQVPQQGEA
ncbi:hypothetical protein D3C71_809690 [compost metagenome]